ncbi:alpha/beta fold hydrolase [Rhodococcus sp. NPDC056960]|uniref:alpha/beta fold hydrolase n=1 Tax=Rhodococcus sp. NPDC056960 TaxID=3345982 RepID=UPI003628AEF6
MNSIWNDLVGASVGFRGNKYKTRVIEAGEGQPLVLMHGNGGHAEAFSRNIMRLSENYHVLAIDLMWHGFSSGREFTTDMVPAYVDQVIDLLDSIGADSAHLEGESLGGWVAMWAALHHPDRVGKIILNTTAGAELEALQVTPERLEAKKSLRERSLAAINDPTRETVRKRLEWLMAEPSRVTEELVTLRQFFYERPETRDGLVNVMQNSFTLDSPHRITAEMLGQIKQPTLVLWSDHNPGTGPEFGRQLSSVIPDAQYHCVADAGHWPQWEKPEEHDSVVTAFLQA